MQIYKRKKSIKSISKYNGNIYKKKINNNNNRIQIKQIRVIK